MRCIRYCFTQSLSLSLWVAITVYGHGEYVQAFRLLTLIGAFHWIWPCSNMWLHNFGLKCGKINRTRFLCEIHMHNWSVMLLYKWTWRKFNYNWNDHHSSPDIGHTLWNAKIEVAKYWIWIYNSEAETHSAYAVYVLIHDLLCEYEWCYCWNPTINN